MRDRDLISLSPRRDPVRGLVVGHSESGLWIEARRWADAVLIAAVIAAASIAI